MHSSQFSFYFFLSVFSVMMANKQANIHTHCATMSTRMNVAEKKHKKNSFLFIFNWNRLTNRFTRHIFSYIFNVSFSATTNPHTSTSTLTHMQHTIRNESGNAVSRQHNFGLSCTRLDISNGCYTSWSIVWIDWKTIGMCSWQGRLDAHVCTEFLRRQRHCWCTGKYLLRRCMGLHWTPIIAVINVTFDKSHLIDFNKIKLDLSGSITSLASHIQSLAAKLKSNACSNCFFFFLFYFKFIFLFTCYMLDVASAIRT